MRYGKLDCVVQSCCILEWIHNMEPFPVEEERQRRRAEAPNIYNLGQNYLRQIENTLAFLHDLEKKIPSHHTSIFPPLTSNVVLDITGFVWASIITKMTLNAGGPDGRLWPRNYKTGKSVSTVLSEVACYVCFFKSLKLQYRKSDPFHFFHRCSTCIIFCTEQQRSN